MQTLRLGLDDLTEALRLPEPVLLVGRLYLGGWLMPRGFSPPDTRINTIEDHQRGGVIVDSNEIGKLVFRTARTNPRVGGPTSCVDHVEIVGRLLPSATQPIVAVLTDLSSLTVIRDDWLDAADQPHRVQVIPPVQ